MNFELESVIMMVAVCAAVYFAGYRSLAVGIFVLLVFSFFVSGGAKKKTTAEETIVEGLRVQGAEVLKPIIIETKRGAPFRIPEKMFIRINPKWGATTWVERASGKFLGRLARFSYGMYRGDVGKKWQGGNS